MPIFGNEIRTGSSAGGFSPENTPFTNYYYFVWGNNNNSGQLGQGNTTGICSPVQIGDHVWKYMRGGTIEGSAAIAGIKANGTLWMCGENGHGQLGIGNTIDKSSPVQVGSATTWNQITCGRATTYAIKTDGTMWVWGDGDHGKLGDGDGDGHTEDEPVQLGSLTNWGDGEFSIENNSRIAGGNSHAHTIKKDGTLWGWGENDHGQMGDGTTIERTSPVQIGTDTWLSVTAGSDHSIAINSDGELYAIGRNSGGQLGLGNTISVSTPTQIGSATNWVHCKAASYMSCAINSSGELWTWGQQSGGGGTGVLGHGNTTDISAPAQVGSLTNWKYVAVSFEGMTAVKTDGTAWGWGVWTHHPHNNQISYSSPVQIGSRTDYTWPSKFGTGGCLGSSATI